ncbi:hypothetical protein GCM10027290_45860 [Micromonospora sonneratiae]
MFALRTLMPVVVLRGCSAAVHRTGVDWTVRHVRPLEPDDIRRYVDRWDPDGR